MHRQNIVFLAVVILTISSFIENPDAQESNGKLFY